MQKTCLFQTNYLRRSFQFDSQTISASFENCVFSILCLFMYAIWSVLRIYIYAAQHNNQHVTSFKRTKQKLHQIRSQLTLLFAVKGIYTILILVNIATKFSVNRLDKHELSSFRYLSVVLICFLCFNKYI